MYRVWDSICGLRLCCLWSTGVRARGSLFGLRFTLQLGFSMPGACWAETLGSNGGISYGRMTTNLQRS